MVDDQVVTDKATEEFVPSWMTAAARVQFYALCDCSRNRLRMWLVQNQHLWLIQFQVVLWLLILGFNFRIKSKESQTN